ncbi:UNVERIFIED_CONTAM: Leucine-rich repeat receptor-like serine/threonine/tyrosine-protein kinase SOBIR1 [Sesamum radiatum]|uniref:Leucine-rich repeat receptor-like serine/threonine/tyrosine-protein kinase SOBIR1 n=1 Tax=Sesamum radiatum TaxID=300843 RepID=A0AAW2S0C3_SESRA
MALSHFFLVCFFALTLIVQSRIHLHPSDHDALLAILKDFGIEPKRSLCNSAGIFCQQRIANTSDSLRVSRLVFESQRLRGKLSPAIGQLSELHALSLSDNQLVGQIPPQIIDCKKLEVLNLRSNGFSGKIPIGLSSLIRLRVLDLSSNKFTGDLKFLKYFPNLEKLNLADNMFDGVVPASLRSFPSLQFINISCNNLVEGSAPLMNNQLDQYLSSELAEKDSIPKRYAFAESSQAAISPLLSEAHHQEQNRNRSTRRRKRKQLLLRLIRGRRNYTRLRIFSPMIKKPEDLAFLEKEDGLASLEVIGRGDAGKFTKLFYLEAMGKK